MAEENDALRELVAEVAAAYFSNSHTNPSDIPSVIGQIAEGLKGVGSVSAQAEEPAEEAAPAQKLTRAQINKSIRPDALISFEDGKAYKTLKRHLSTRGLTPAEYREKWGLAKDYPMVSPAYSEARSAMAKSLGLGRKPAAPAKPARGRRKAPATTETPLG